MSLLADIAAELPEMRRRAESLMVDTITFAAPGTETYDDATGEYVTTPGATIYSGPCQIQVTDTVPRDATVGESQLVIERIIVKIPWDATAVPVNSVGTVSAVGSASGAPVGAKYRVIGNHDKTFATASRIPCELITA